MGFYLSVSTILFSPYVNIFFHFTIKNPKSEAAERISKLKKDFSIAEDARQKFIKANPFEKKSNAF